jgi:hypothetical protein
MTTVKDANPPVRKRAKQKPLADADGEPLKSLDKNGEPIDQGVVTDKVRQRVEDYSAAVYEFGQAKKNKEIVGHDLEEAMHEAGITSVIAKDHEGISYRYVLKTAERIKRQKIKDGVFESDASDDE